ncbi:MAG: shikimate dehydrogenase [Actinobacteria bacterium]|nr:MAG: shikimate dehydrogenase [Actinomycetota bacterium]
MHIDGKTQMVGIVGHGIAYTLSPAIHNAAFSDLEMNWIYVPLRVVPGALEPALLGLRVLGFRGCNVTIPHKLEAARCVDELRGAAGILKSVNTVVHDEGRLVGCNTDVEGFRAFLAEAGVRAAGSTTLLIGAGGAARAVALALAEEGAARIFVMNRSRERAAELEVLLKRVIPATEISLRTYDLEGSRVLGECDMVVNCTPLASRAGSELPLDYEGFTMDKWAIDLKYASRATAFMEEASARGAKTADGEGMLLHQAAASFRLWTGQSAPLRVMREAYRRALTAGNG